MIAPAGSLTPAGLIAPAELIRGGRLMALSGPIARELIEDLAEVPAFAFG